MVGTGSALMESAALWGIARYAAMCHLTHFGGDRPVIIVDVKGDAAIYHGRIARAARENGIDVVCWARASLREDGIAAKRGPSLKAWGGPAGVRKAIREGRGAEGRMRRSWGMALDSLKVQAAMNGGEKKALSSPTIGLHPVLRYMLLRQLEMEEEAEGFLYDAAIMWILDRHALGPMRISPGEALEEAARRLLERCISP